MKWTERRKVAAAAALSVILHLMGVGALALLGVSRPEESPDIPRPEPELTEITVIRQAPPTPASTPFLETPEDRASERPPETPLFESDRDSLAASELPASGESDLPSQDGRETPGLDLADREHTAGPGPLPGIPAAAPANPVAAEAAIRPTPVPREPSARPTPPVDALALLPPRPTPTPAEDPTDDPEERADDRPLAPSETRPSRLPGYQREQRRTKIEGRVDSRGRTSVDAVGTPLGRYKKTLSDAIGSRWYFYTRSNIDKISIGTARVRFFVDEEGTVEDIEILDNSSNSTFGTYTLQAVLDAEIPPIPGEIAQTLEDNRLEVEYTFTVYGGRMP